MIIGIVAISKDLAIGKDGKLPWHYSSDLKFFKQTTTGNAVVMGANTWRSIGRPLPNRLNVVISRSGTIDTPPEVVRFSNKKEVVDFAKVYDHDVFIIGGAQTYKEFAADIDKWIVTEIPINVPSADTFMPENFLDDFRMSETRELGEGLTAKIFLRI